MFKKLSAVFRDRALLRGIHLKNLTGPAYSRRQTNARPMG